MLEPTTRFDKAWMELNIRDRARALSNLVKTLPYSKTPDVKLQRLRVVQRTAQELAEDCGRIIGVLEEEIS